MQKVSVQWMSILDVQVLRVDESFINLGSSIRFPQIHIECYKI